MKLPRKILVPNTYPLNNSQVSYTEYKFRSKLYDDCYEYIYWWQNGDGKWRCMKIYLEKGNKLWYAYMLYLKTHENDYSGWSCIFVD